jgi:Glutamate-cysteine ligase
MIPNIRLLKLPLQVDENLKRAHKRSAATGQRFYWRQHMAPPNGSEEKSDAPAEAAKSDMPPVAEGGTGADAGAPRGRPSAAADHDHAHDHEHNSCHQEDIGYEEMTIYEV